MEQMLIYVGVVVGLFLIGSGALYIKRKLNLQDEDMEYVGLVLETVNYITKQFEFKYKENVSDIVEYSIEAIDFIEEYEDVQDIEFKKELVKEKALIICEKEGVDLGDGTIVEIVDSIVDFLVEQEAVNQHL